MACSGLHCAGCAGGASVPPVAFAALYGIAWVAEHLVEVAIVAGTCSAVAVAAVVALMRWADRRDARHAQLWAARTVPQTGTRVPIPGTLAADQIRHGVTNSSRLELEPPAVHLHFHGLPDAEQAEVIRRAIGG